MATLKRWRYGRRSEQLDAVQRSLLDESIDADLEAISLEIEALREKPPRRRRRSRAAWRCRHASRAGKSGTSPSTLSAAAAAARAHRRGCQREARLHPRRVQVERHIRGKWVCRGCETLIQAPVPPHIIDKGIPTAGLLAQVLIAKYLDHVPLYRQERHLRARGTGAAALDAGAVGRCLRRAAAAAGRCAEGGAADPRGAARR